MAEDVESVESSSTFIPLGESLPDQQTKKKNPRPYQTELVEHALRENTIVNLGTGAGKTFIAVMLIREMSGDIQGEFTKESGKRTVFLAHTVPLVKQQAGYIRDNTSLKVQDFCGDSKGIDHWPESKWYDHFNSNHVLVMSRQIFLDLLSHGIITPRQLNLIVFDECHHATKNDPYVQIMKVVKDAPVEERPRVLGLSASLLAKKVKPGELKKGVVGLEQILMSHARTAKDLQDVLRNATAPVEKILNYKIDDDPICSSLKNIIDGPLVMFQTKLADKRIKLRLGEVAKNLYEDLLSILTDLGPASAAGFVTDAIQELKRSMVALQNNTEKFDQGLAVVALTHLTLFDMKCRIFLKKYGKLQDSNKVKTLLLLLGDTLVQTASSDSSENESSPKDKKDTKKQKNDLRGIIFVERRHTASCLCKMLRRKRKEESDLKRIHCDFVVGHNVGQNATSIRKEARMKSSKQEITLSKFRKGTINILIATSVIEEGVDVPKCNLVVRFDLPQNFRSYVQSKGRARNKPSLFYLLVGDHQGNKVADISNYHRLEEELIELCQEDRKVPSEEEIQKKMRDKVPPYMPNGRDGARATIGNSMTILHRYCYKLPHDDYTKLAPIFEVVKLPKDRTKKSITLPGEMEEEDEDPNHNYICTITLPINCPIRGEPIKGPEMGSKLQAHRAAARIAVEQLHRAGELDDRFFPIPSIDSDDEETIKEKENSLSGTERRHWMYRNEVSGFVQGCYPMINEEVFLYAFIMTNAADNSMYCSNTTTTSMEETFTTFGLLTRNPLPYQKIPKFSLFIKRVEDGEVEVLVSLLQLSDKKTFVQEELDVLSSYHKSIFSDVLEVIPKYMEWNITKAEKDYLVVPLKLKSHQPTSGSIDFELIANMEPHSTVSQPSWPCSDSEYSNALVSAAHRDSVGTPVGVELYTVTVDHNISPLSSFPTAQFKSFQEYLQKKCNCEIQDLTQPGLRAYRFSISSLKYISSNYNVSGGSVSIMPPPPRDDKKIHTVFFPEIVNIHHIRANVFKLMKCLPSILWRLESLLLMEDLTAEFQTTEYAIFTDTPLRYGDTPFEYGDLNGGVVTDIFSRKPDNSLLLQSFTPKAANDAINLERLELLGDSLLKIVSSVYLFNHRVDHHEGKLSGARSRRISNVKLYLKAKYKNTILGKIQSNDMLMGSDSSGSPLERIRYLPPGFIITPSPPQGGDYPLGINLDNPNTHPLPPEVSKYLYHRFNDKMVADCMEALIGAFTISGGIEGGLSFMKWLKLDILMSSEATTKTDHLRYDPSVSWAGEAPSVPLIIAESSYIFQKHFGMINMTQTVNDRETFNRFMAQTGTIQRKLGYTFTNHCLMFEALTHPSYSRPVSYGCYPRLEFLGDAVLDYLVIAHLFHSNQSMTPGTISSIRSALLCHHRLAEFAAVNLEVHRHWMHGSPDLFKEVGIYQTAIMKKCSPSETSPELDQEDSSEEESDNESESDYEDVVEGDELFYDDDDSDQSSLDPPKPLSDIFEALCGAVFLDTKMSLSKTWEVFKKFLEPTMREYIQDNGEIRVPVNEVKQLYDLVPVGIQLKRKKIREGFQCVIKIPDKGINVSGESRSFKNAKILAANQALKQL